MSAGRIARHRNYGELLERHERDQKIKRLMKLFVYFLLVAFFIIVFIMVSRWEKRESQEPNQKPTTSVSVNHSSSSVDT